ncbi:hypothetical protein FIV42_17470 [Persicimonas caeni]|uniref:Uncharacterized protein n=1 Tax=Persicimonas caeni TaxID=2292766 RepID=A0A4Y6PW38_PERCE|nr:hypothetical protein [Persicimonas caeni]QDG52463.1 hypothetical protein FIV42_17470 [Persicimonas caeni]QED33685.1 hypothetical protein FRD00_17465 [Persicimonas caeni]
MAITPRTVLSEPINLLVFAFGVFAVGGLIGVIWSADGGDERSRCPALQAHAQRAADVGAVSHGFEEDNGPPELAEASQADASHRAALDYTCRLDTPAHDWNEAHWLRHLDCMEARGEPTEVILAETSAAIESVGLTPELAVKKADALEAVAGPDEHIAFLEQAVDRLGVVDGQLVHRLARALTWRGHQNDIEQIRHLQLLSRMLMPDSCEVQQTDIWVRYHLAQQMAQGPSPVAWDGVQRAVRHYVDRGCHERLHEGRWETLAEIVGVGVAAEATNGHSGHSSLLREVAGSFEVRQVPTFCREAVPEGTGLRSYCEKRMGDELFLSRR